MNRPIGTGARGGATLLLLVAAAFPPIHPHPLHAQAALGPVIGTEYGFGGLLRAGSGSFQLEAGAGFTPVFVLVAVTGGDNIFHLYFPGTVGAKASFSVRTAKDSSQFHFELGATYSSLLRLGGGGGVSYRPARSRLLASVGLMFYPDAKDRLRQRVNRDEGLSITDAEFQSPLTFLQPYASISILLGR